MITFWNRKEVYMGFSLDTLQKAISILKKNNLNYKYKYGNVGAFAVTDQNGSPCYLYVHKNDYEQASYFLNSAGIGK